MNGPLIIAASLDDSFKAWLRMPKHCLRAVLLTDERNRDLIPEDLFFSVYYFDLALLRFCFNSKAFREENILALFYQTLPKLSGVKDIWNLSTDCISKTLVEFYRTQDTHISGHYLSNNAQTLCSSLVEYESSKFFMPLTQIDHRERTFQGQSDKVLMVIDRIETKHSAQSLINHYPHVFDESVCLWPQDPKRGYLEVYLKNCTILITDNPFLFYQTDHQTTLLSLVFQENMLWKSFLGNCSISINCSLLEEVPSRKRGLPVPPFSDFLMVFEGKALKSKNWESMKWFAHGLILEAYLARKKHGIQNEIMMTEILFERYSDLILQSCVEEQRLDLKEFAKELLQNIKTWRGSSTTDDVQEPKDEDLRCPTLASHLRRQIMFKRNNSSRFERTLFQSKKEITEANRFLEKISEKIQHTNQVQHYA